jgi:subtilisin-like proprotein convertase family protein
MKRSNHSRGRAPGFRWRAPLRLALTLPVVPSLAAASGEAATPTISGDPPPPIHASVDVGIAVPDNDIRGLASSLDLSAPDTLVGKVTVTLEIQDGYNGDLYAYLVHDTGFSVLLNRVGRSATSPGGYSDSGFAITLDDAAPTGDVHRYREALGGTPLPAALTGTWQPDARDTDPALTLDTDARTARLDSFQGLGADGLWTLFVADLDGGSEATLVRWGLNIEEQLPSVVGRYLAYNNSAWDGGSPTLATTDDAAIAPDKSALLPGQRAGFANYSAFSRGLNCVMIDLAALPGTPTLADFDFRVGNTADPAEWAAAPTPLELVVRSGAGVANSTRVGIRWADNAIRKQWLQVTVRPTAATGLSQPDVFYFGNAVGETGNSTSDARVTAADALRVLGNVSASAAITNRFDHNRDGRVGAADRLIVLGNLSAIAPLILLDLSGSPALAADPGPRPTISTDWEMRPVESGLAVAWTDAGSPVRIWTTAAVPGNAWEIYDTVGSDGLPGERRGMLLPVDADEPARFYQFEVLRNE